MSRRRHATWRWRTITVSGFSFDGSSPRRLVLQRSSWPHCAVDLETLTVQLWTGDYWYEVDAERDTVNDWMRHIEEKVWYTTTVGLQFRDAWRFLQTWRTLLGQIPGHEIEIVTRAWRPTRRTAREGEPATS